MKYFTISELSASSVAKKNNIDNTPDEESIKNLTALVEELMDPVREELGMPIIVTSGFRSKALNTILLGSKTSAHLRGAAIDCYCKDNKMLLEILKKHEFDQIIIHNGWIHVGYNSKESGRKNRMQVFNSIP